MEFFHKIYTRSKQFLGFNSSYTNFKFFVVPFALNLYSYFLSLVVFNKKIVFIKCSWLQIDKIYLDRVPDCNHTVGHISQLVSLKCRATLPAVFLFQFGPVVACSPSLAPFLLHPFFVTTLRFTKLWLSVISYDWYNRNDDSTIQKLFKLLLLRKL